MRPPLWWGKEETDMKCKFCQAELQSNSSVCPNCGKDNLKDNLKGLKITALVLVCLVMLVLLAGLVSYGVTGSFIPWAGSSDSTDSTDGTDGTGDAVSDAPVDVTVITADGEITVPSDELDSYMSKVVATMGDYEMTNSELQLYYWLVAYNETEADPYTSLADQIYDETTGETCHEYCLRTAVDAWKEVMVMADAAKQAGFEMPADAQEYLDALESELEYYVYMYTYYYGYNMETVDDLIQSMYGPGCTYEDYYNYCYNYYYGGRYWTEVADAIEVSETEIDNYFTENEEALKTDYSLSITKDFGNMMDIRNIFIALVTTEDEDGNVTTDWDATQKKAQDVYDLWLAGDKTEESFIALVAEHSEDTGSNADGGLYNDLYKTCMSEVDVRHILITPEEDTDEGWANAYTKAEDLLEQWIQGGQTEDSFAELANENSADSDGTDGGLYEDVYVGQMVEEFEAWCFDDSRTTGDYGIVKTQYGYHIMYFVRADREVDDWISDETRAAGDVELIKTDDGYQLIYFVASEPAWHRYCRYGVQADQAQAQLDVLMEENEVTLDESQVAICLILE